MPSRAPTYFRHMAAQEEARALRGLSIEERVAAVLARGVKLVISDAHEGLKLRIGAGQGHFHASKALAWSPCFCLAVEMRLPRLPAPSRPT
jgi:hypothetical protein